MFFEIVPIGRLLYEFTANAAPNVLPKTGITLETMPILKLEHLDVFGRPRALPAPCEHIWIGLQ